MRLQFWLGTICACVALSSSVNAQMQMPMSSETQQQGPQLPTIVADQSKAKSPPAPIEPGVRGYGTRGIEGHTLPEMKTACAADRRSDAVLVARCDQLRRTLKTTPGNTR